MFFDYDKDGDLDAYILNNSFIPAEAAHENAQRHRQLSCHGRWRTG
jgi:hypothetical protein